LINFYLKCSHIFLNILPATLYTFALVQAVSLCPFKKCCCSTSHRRHQIDRWKSLSARSELQTRCDGTSKCISSNVLFVIAAVCVVVEETDAF